MEKSFPDVQYPPPSNRRRYSDSSSVYLPEVMVRSKDEYEESLGKQKAKDIQTIEEPTEYIVEPERKEQEAYVIEKGEHVLAPQAVVDDITEENEIVDVQQKPIRYEQVEAADTRTKHYQNLDEVRILYKLLYIKMCLQISWKPVVPCIIIPRCQYYITDFALN